MEQAGIRIYGMGGLMFGMHNLVLITIIINLIIRPLCDFTVLGKTINRKYLQYTGKDIYLSKTEIENLYKKP